MAYKLQDIPAGYVQAVHFNGGRYAVSDLLDQFLTIDDNEGWSLNITEPEAWELAEAWDDEGGLTNVSGECNAYFYDNLISKIV